eukprot:5492682-Lingulodinium_polyedra.AAC.1
MESVRVWECIRSARVWVWSIFARANCCELNRRAFGNACSNRVCNARRTRVAAKHVRMQMLRTEWER